MGTIEQIPVIDVKPMYNGEKKFITDWDGWIRLFNEQERNTKGKRMITSAEIIKFPNRVIRDFFDAKRNFNEHLYTSTAVIYEKGLSGKIVHNYGCTIPGVNSTTIKIDEIPFYRTGTPISKVLEEPVGLKLIRALAGDVDISAKQLCKNLELISGRDIDSVKFFTENPESRVLYPNSFVGFTNYFSGFNISACSLASIEDLIKMDGDPNPNLDDGAAFDDTPFYTGQTYGVSIDSSIVDKE